MEENQPIVPFSLLIVRGSKHRYEMLKYDVIYEVPLYSFTTLKSITRLTLKGTPNMFSNLFNTHVLVLLDDSI